MAEKKFSVRFYVGTRGEPGAGLKLSGLLQNLADAGGTGPNFPDAGLRFELRQLVSLNDGAVVKGAFAVLRDDAPHIRKADGEEHPIELEADDGVIEKNYFIYYRKHELLAYQVNGRGSHVSRFANYLTACTGTKDTIAFADVLSLDAFERLNQGIVKAFDIRVAKPKNAQLVAPDVWEHSAFQMMQGAEASIISVTVRTRSKQKGLSAGLKDVAYRLLESDYARKVNVLLQGDDVPIDLMADSIKDSITVAMNGLYPDPESVFGEIDKAKDRQQGALDAVFGVGNAILA